MDGENNWEGEKKDPTQKCQGLEPSTPILDLCLFQLVWPRQLPTDFHPNLVCPNLIPAHYIIFVFSTQPQARLIRQQEHLKLKFQHRLSPSSCRLDAPVASLFSQNLRAAAA